MILAIRLGPVAPSADGPALVGLSGARAGEPILTGVALTLGRHSLPPGSWPQGRV